MKPMQSLAAALIVMLAAMTGARAQALPAPSRWIDQYGSELYVSFIDAQGHFDAAYTDRRPHSPCQLLPYRVQGNANHAGSLFFTVYLRDCKVILIFSGSHTGKQMKLLQRTQDNHGITKKTSWAMFNWVN